MSRHEKGRDRWHGATLDSTQCQNHTAGRRNAEGWTRGRR
jgi:hypothetical protein